MESLCDLMSLPKNAKTLALAVLFSPLPITPISQAHAAAEPSSAEVDSRYDVNGDGFVDTDEFRIFSLHVANPTLREYDTGPINGRLDPQELDFLYHQAHKRLETDPVVKAAVVGVATQLELAGGKVPVREISIPDFAKLDKDMAEERELRKEDCTLDDRLFIRRDKVDMSIYNNKVGVAEKKGASFSIKGDLDSDSSVAEIDAAAAWVIARSTCIDFDSDDRVEQAHVSGWSLAAYADLDGNIQSSNRASEKSVARFGLDGQLELQGGLFRYQYATLGPYVQTDFRGDELAYGAEASWQPLDERIKMGITAADPNIEWYWTPIVRMDAFVVESPGSSALEANTTYFWLGGDLDVRVNIMPSVFERRLYAIGSGKFYWNINGSETALEYGAELAYNLDPKGYTSVSLEYANGKSRKTLIEDESIKLNLNFKY